MLNNCTFMGRLTRDPELRRTGNGVAVTSFTIAVDRDIASKENGERTTDFLDFVAWRSTGEFIAKYFKKGNMIVVNARAAQRQWTDKDGNKRNSIEFIVESAYFGEGKKQDGNNAQQGGYGPAPANGGYGYAGASGYSAPPAPAGNYGAAPASTPGYNAPAPADNGYGYNAAPGYGAPAAPQGYTQPAPAPAAAPQGYAQPAAPQFALLTDEDAQLPY